MFKCEDRGLNIALTVLICLIIVLAAVMFDESATQREGIDRYNNGTCSLCGGEFQFEQTIEKNIQIHYVFLCRTCGNIAVIGEKQWNKIHSLTH